MLLLAATLLTATLLAGCGQGNYDADGDRLYDSVERDGWDITVDLMNERVRRHVTSDPHSDDSDGDGMSDTMEFQLPGLDPSRKDTDDDGLTDCQETLHTNAAQCEDPAYEGPRDGGYRTNAARADSDPGYSRYINNVRGFNDTTGTLANGLADSGDGISDGDEIQGYEILLGNGATRRVTTSPLNGDVDDDGLEDGEELHVYASDPTVPDSDGDGCIDGLDLFPEREERFLPGLGTFTLKKAGSANLRVFTLAANLEAFTPVGGPMVVESGKPVNLAPFQGSPGRSEDCSYAPYHPWVTVEVHAIDNTPSGPVSLDISSETAAPVPSGHATRFFWDVRGAQLSWSAEGTDAWPLSAGLRLEGADGVLDLKPEVH